jgi:hypothetical protein
MAAIVHRFDVTHEKIPRFSPQAIPQFSGRF